MKHLLLILALIGCGADPDDFKPEEADGCKSTDTECKAKLDAAKLETSSGTDTDEGAQADSQSTQTDEKGNIITVENNVTVNTNIVIGPKGEKIDKDNADNCQAGKICRGITKAEVTDLLGDPDSLSKTDPFEKWTWTRLDDEYKSVQCSGYHCTISFRDGVVVDQKNIKAQWLDLENF